MINIIATADYINLISCSCLFVVEEIDPSSNWQDFMKFINVWILTLDKSSLRHNKEHNIDYVIAIFGSSYLYVKS